MWVGVLDRLVAKDLARGLEVFDDHRVGVEDHQPSYGGTSAVNRPPGSSGWTTSMPYAVASSMSSSPKAGARCTIPVPLSVVT